MVLSERGTASVLRSRAGEAYRRGAHLEALDLYTQLCRDCPGDAQAWHMAAAINGMVGRYREAVDCCRQVIGLRPQAQGAYTNLANALLGLGQWEEAKRSFEQALTLNSRDPQALNGLATIMQRQGRSAEAERLYRRALQFSPDFIEVRNNLAALLIQCGRLDEAVEHLRSAVCIRPDYVEAWCNLGGVYTRMGAYADAVTAFGEALRANPHSAAAYGGLGFAHLGADQYGDAADAYGRALELGADSAEFRLQLARALRLDGRFRQARSVCFEVLRRSPEHFEGWCLYGATSVLLEAWEEAIDAYRRAIRLRPGVTDARLGLAKSLMAAGRVDEAVGAYRELVAIDGGCAQAQNDLGVLQQAQGDMHGAEAHYRRAIDLDPQLVEAYCNLGGLFAERHDHNKALSWYDQALEIRERYPAAIAGKAAVLELRGEIDAAYHLLAPLVEGGSRSPRVAGIYAKLAPHYGESRQAVALAEAVLSEGGVSEQRRVELYFALGGLYDRLGEFEQAFEQYRIGNSLKAGDFDAKRYAAALREIETVFSADFMARAPRVSTQSDRPVFIIGMPRSGTSLVEQILASHHAVFGAGELDWLHELSLRVTRLSESSLPFPLCVPDVKADVLDAVAKEYLTALGDLAPTALRVTDKMPSNYSLLGLIDLLFPGARVIHCVRDPRDICLSCYFQNFSKGHGYTYDLTGLIYYYKGYRRLMRHWSGILRIPIFEVQYEGLVADMESASRRLVEFCGLDWDPACLHYYENARTVATASYDQVRRPIYQRSVGRWKRYERYIAPLLQALGTPNAGDDPAPR